MSTQTIQTTQKTIRPLTPYEKVLFGEEASSSLIEAQAIISEYRPLETEDLLGWIKHSPFINPEESSFVLILQAIFAQRGRFSSENILRLFLKYCKEENYVPKYPVNLVIGLLVGFRKYAPSVGPGRGLDHLSDILQFFMTGEFTFERWSSSSSDKSLGQLSESISAFLTGGETSPGIGGRVTCITNAITATKKKLDAGEKLSDFGKVLMEELCRKVFGKMSIYGKMDAVTLTIEDMMKPATPAVVAS